MNQSDLFEKLHFFIHSNERNKWINDGLFKIYIRKSGRMLKGKMRKCLDLASFEVLDENNYGKGIFTNFLTELLKIYSTTNIFVESILNSKVEFILKKFNFEEQHLGSYQLNMFLIQEEE